MHDATKQVNELAGDLKTSPIGELANRVRGCRPDQSDCIKRRRAIGCVHNSGDMYPAITRQTAKRRYFACDDDPTFLKFRSILDGFFEKNNDEIPKYLCYSLWYESRNFRSHWKARYSNETARKMMFILSDRLVPAL